MDDQTKSKADLIAEVTALRQQLIQAQKMEANLHTLVHHVDLGVMLQGPQAEILLTNQVSLDLLGLTEDQLLGKTSFDPDWNVIHEDGSPFPGEWHPVPQAIATKQPIRNVVMGVYRPKTKDRVWLLVSAIPELDGAGNIKQVICSFSDITARKSAEAALRAERDLLDGIMNTSIAAITVLDTEGAIIFANDSAERVLGLTKREITQRTYDAPEWRFTDLDGSPWPDEKQPFRRVIETGQPVFDIRHGIEWPNGQRRLLSINGAPIRDDAGKINWLVFSVSDITDRLRLEAQLRQAQKMEGIGQLAGGIAHEFNNLLTIIQGNTALAQTLLLEDHPVQQELHKVQRATAQAAKLTHQLLIFSRRKQTQAQIIDLNKVVTHVQTLLRSSINRRVELVIEMAADLHLIRSDAGQLEQALMNLVTNACDAMPDGGTVHIETANVALDEQHASNYPNVIAGPHVKLAVSDTGQGMAEEIKQQIFEPFFTTKGVGEGTGLGLAVVHGVVDLWGGHLTVESELHQGTAVTLYFPKHQT